MSDDLYKAIFSKKLKYYMKLNNKTQADLINDLGVSSSTISNWCTGLKLPRMGKIQMLADYFHINKSDLIEEKEPEHLGDYTMIGHRIREVRTSLGLTQVVFGERLGVSRDVINNSELERATISPLLIKAISLEFSINENWLVNGIGEMFVKQGNDLLKELKEKYQLTNIEYVILKSYLNLDAIKRKEVSKFIENDIISKIVDPIGNIINKAADDAYAEYLNEENKEKQELG